MDLTKCVPSEKKNVCVQGLGFVGAAMALAIACAEDPDGVPLYNVIGIDIPSDKGYERVESINHGVFPFVCSDKKLLEAQRIAKKNGNCTATTDPSCLQCADIVLIDINLDVEYTKEHRPRLNLEPFKDAVRTVGHYIKPETLVIVETTVPPGTCEKVVYPILTEEFERRGLKECRVLLAHSYERVMPGENYFDSITNYWRVYSGIDEESSNLCQKFLESVIKTEKYPLTRLHRPAASETAKVLENSYRAANIAFIEEWGRFAETIGIDLYEVIDAIRMRPTHSNMRQPGFGVGGYCLTKDPYFAALAAKYIFGLENMEFPFSTKAVEVNNAMPLVSLNKVEALLGGNLMGKNLLILGVSYRQDIGDTRYSPAEIFVKEAQQRGANVECQDPMVTYWNEMNMDVLHDIPTFEGYNAVVFTVPHKQYQELVFRNEQFMRNIVIFDANRVLSEQQRTVLAGFEHVILSGIGR